MSIDLSQKILEEIYQELELRNTQYNAASIVHSDEFAKFISSSMGLTKEVTTHAIRILMKAHKILNIEISPEDEGRNIEKVDGYVVADLTIVRNINNVYKDILANAYEKENGARKGASQIMKEIFHKINSIKHTEFGQIANKAVIINEYEGLLERNWKEYSLKWQEQMLAEIATEIHMEYTPSVEGVNAVTNTVEEAQELIEPEEKISSLSTNRAVDSENYNEYAAKKNKYPLQKILKIYGADFFFRSNLRKYEFDYIKKIVDDNQITRRQDLNVLHEMLRAVKKNMYIDKKLEQYKENIFELDKSVVHAIHFSSNR